MKFPEIIDLHMHTTVSDGTDTPEEILEKAKNAGIDMFSVTDHDAVDGASEIKKITKAAPEGQMPLFVNGVEFSCLDELGKYHILGYGYDENSFSMKETVSKSHGYRMSKVMDRINFLKDEFGFTFKQEDIDEIFRNANPGKPHISKMMIKYGYASSINEAMDNYLNKKKFPDRVLTPQEAVTAIREGNGVPVLAHGFFGDGSQLILGDEMEERIRHLLDLGLEGLECYYSGFTEKLTGQMLDFADKYDLYVTAGSDYHGRNKLVRLKDTNLKRVSDDPGRVRKFLERVLQED